MDEVNRAIDRALQDLADVRPSPDFLPRLRAHVEASRRPLFPFSWMPVIAAAGVGLLVFAVYVTRADRTDVPMTAHGSDIALVRTLGEPQGREAPESREPRHRSRTYRERSGLRETGESRFDVLVPPDQTTAIARLLEAVSTGKTDADSVRRVLAPREPLAIAPIRIDPVVVPALPGVLEEIR